MKRLFTLLLISFAALSCETTDEKLDDLLDKRDWVVFAEGTELSVDVPSKQTVLNYKFESALDWEVKTEAEWLEIDPMSGKAGKDIKIQIKVAKNKDKEGRTGYADLTLSNDESYRITINQAGEGDENEDVVVDIPHNQIWYTSVDGEIVEPYSGEYNEYADALTTFGANIVSNTYKNGLGVITFDRDVTTIGSYAFSGLDGDSINLTVVETSCIKLESIIIPDSVTTIGEAAFYECSSLTSVTIPDSVTTIGDGAFSSCDSLQEFSGKFASEDGRCLVIEGVLNSFAPAGITGYTIPDSVTTIGSSAFSDCSSLTSVTIPDSVTTIGSSAFSGCSSLTSITIPNNVTAIGEWAFYSCGNLTSVTIPNSVSAIGEWAFSGCRSLTSVTIPDSVTTIGGSAFSYCGSLTIVYCKPITPPTGNDYMFYNYSSRLKIYVPTESVEAYKSASYWEDYASAIVGYDF